MSDEKRPRVFVRGGEGSWCYCGALPTPARTPQGAVGNIYRRADLARDIGERVLSEIEADMGGTGSDAFGLEVKVMSLTDAEVNALPEG